MALFDIAKKVAGTRLGGVLAVLVKYPVYQNRIRCELTDRLPAAPTKKQIRWCFWDYVGFRWKYKGSLDVDYFGTQLYRKSDFVRSESFATNIRFVWRDTVQDSKHWNVFVDKREFYTAFSEYLHRDWKVMDADTTYDEYLAFVNDKQAVFTKTPVSCGGKDVHYWVLDNEQKRRDLFDFLQNGTQILEGSVAQCEKLHSFSAYSVNTLRIITIIDESGMPHVARATFRMGRADSAVDNYSSGGIGAPVDVDTGVIFQPAIDKKGQEYIFHPDSKKQIVGFKIPDWDGYKDFAKKLAMKFPGMRYVGWDIVKDANGNYVVIEGNKDAGADVMEAGLMHGLLPIYNGFLHMGREGKR